MPLVMWSMDIENVNYTQNNKAFLVTLLLDTKFVISQKSWK